MKFSIEFAINQIFAPRAPNKYLSEPVRFLRRNAETALCIPLSSKSKKTGLIFIPIDDWMDFLQRDDPDTSLQDPYAWTPQIQKGLKLPPKALERLKAFEEILRNFYGNEEMLFNNHRLLRFLEEQAILSKPTRSVDTIRRWFYTWLRAGQNPLAVVETFLNVRPTAKQQKGEKRGRKNPLLPPETARPAYEFDESIRKIYKNLSLNDKSTWNDAYTESLTTEFGVSKKDADVFFTDPSVASRYRVPGRHQFLRALRRLRQEEDAGREQPAIGQRGTSRDYAAGPGYFEIDATFFQIQLISRVGARNIVSRPLVYLIVDIYSGVIVGYAISFEEPSWSVAAEALYNCISDKGQTFKRLSLDFVSEDWPCRHLPSVLRADRAELISAMGQDFPKSSIRVEITAPYRGQAKGTVEGKNNELKHTNRHKKMMLPGLYKKFRTRGETDGKWDAALNIDEFEKIIVEIIMFLNRQPVVKKKLPRDAIAAKVSSRQQLWTWGLSNRAGFTSSAHPNFLYEHLLTRSDGLLKPTGIYYKGQRFNCDMLREFRYLQTAPDKGRMIPVAVNKNYAAELFFKGPDELWHRSYNQDIHVSERKLSFRDLADEATEKGRLFEQGALNATTHWNDRATGILEDIKNAKTIAGKFRQIGGVSKQNIRDSRSAERRSSRGPSEDKAAEIPQGQEGHTTVIDRSKTRPPMRKALKFDEDNQ